jgi:phage-related protein
VQAVPQLVEVLLPMIPQIITDLANALADAWPILLDAALQLSILLVTDITPRLITAIVKALPQILEALINGVVKIYNSIKGKLEEWDYKLIAWFKGIGNSIKSWASNLWNRVTTWLSNMVSKVRDSGAKFLSTIISFLSQLPGKVATWLTNALNKVTTWATNLVNKGKDAAKRLVSAVSDGIKSLPGKMLSIGSDLVEGLWKGIGDKVSWLKSKISGFASSVLDGIKDFFGVASPSKEMAWIGDMLDQGLAKGLLDNSSDPIKAMQKVSGAVLDTATSGVNGLALDLQLRFPATSGTAAATGDGSLASKLDAILTAIERGHVITIDGDQLVGATASRYDATLGQRRALAARGAV